MGVLIGASKSSIRRFVITEKAPTKVNVYYPARGVPSSFALLVGKNIGFVGKCFARRAQKIFRGKYTV